MIRSTLTDLLNVTARTLTSPYMDDEMRLQASAVYATASVRFRSATHPTYKSALAAVGEHLHMFIATAADMSEPPALRSLFLGQATGSTLFHISEAASCKRRSRSIALDPSADFRNSSTPFSRCVNASIDFRSLADQALKIAERGTDDTGIRKCALFLFDKISLLGEISFHQDVRLSGLSERLMTVFVTTDDARLQKSAAHIGKRYALQARALKSG